MTLTPYYGQENGQAKEDNKIIISWIKKNMWQKPKNWHKTLDQVLWAFRTSVKEAKTTTPFRLTYGQDPVLPVEIYLQLTRIQRQHEIRCEDYWSLMLDELVDLDEERLKVLNALFLQKERVVKAYNKKVKAKAFSVVDMVWKVILPMDPKDMIMGKWSPN